MNIRAWTGIVVCLAALAMSSAAQAQTAPTHRHKRTAKKHTAVRARTTTAASSSSRSSAQPAVLHARTSPAIARKVAIARRRRGKVFFNPWTEPTYADSTVGDTFEGEDLTVRKAAVDALGPYNGAVVVSDPTTGRILSIVNQKLALKGAFQPCSTVKVMVSLASLSEGLISPETPVHLTRRYSMDMTRALATSNNMYFAHLGQQLGFERVHKYGQMFGVGEKAGLDISGEEPGSLADEVPQSGVGMMTSFGDGIRWTPLELTGLIDAVANGGTLYYLQYPRTQDEVQKFIPRIKRELNISNLVPQIRPGMMGAVEYGTARRANFESSPTIYGKTGTCTDTAQPGVHLGWFGSFTEVGTRKVSVVVLLTGGRGISGPIASGVAGNVYHNLTQAHYFDSAAPALPMSPVSTTSLVPDETLIRQ